MRDHRDIGPGETPPLSEITKAVQQHSTKHPGSVKRASLPAKQKRAKRKQVVKSRRANR